MAEVKWTCDLQISFVCLVIKQAVFITDNQTDECAVQHGFGLQCCSLLQFLGRGGGFQLISFL